MASLENEQEAVGLAKAALEAVRPIRESQMDDGHNEDIPLVTGNVPLKVVTACMFQHPEMDHNLRSSMMWIPKGNDLLALIITFTEEGEREAVRRIAYRCNA